MTGAAETLSRREAVVAAALGWIGTPWVPQASLRGAGCDCLGLVRGVWREVIGPEPVEIPPYALDWGECGSVEPLLLGLRRVMRAVARPEPGDVLVFRMRRHALAKHCGILVEPGLLVHARERLGVVREPAGPWARRLVAAFRYPGERG